MLKAVFIGLFSKSILNLEILWYVIRFRGRNPFKGGGLVTPLKYKSLYHKIQRIDKQEFTN
ncbi:hypothetical protein Hanom_Chr08g00730581 [Helianthus anomalus]